MREQKGIFGPAVLSNDSAPQIDDMSELSRLFPERSRPDASEPFGVDRYYSDQSASEFSSETEAAQFFQDVLGSAHARANDQSLDDSLDELENQVLTAKRRWRAKTRTKVNTETKLDLSHDGRQESIPVRIRGGVPSPLANAFQQHGDPLLWRLLLERPTLETTLRGLDVAGRSFDELPRRRTMESFNGFVETDMSRGDLARVTEFVEKLLEELEETRVQSAFRNINSDILGAYHFRVPVIHLYWIPIVAISRYLGVSPESLAAVTLLHERAHAYSHRGFDADGNQWQIDNFAESDLPIVEGLAQYYTWSVCKSVRKKYPEWLEAFIRLANFQSPAYRSFLRWQPESDGAGEVIRRAMIVARNKPIRDIGEFEDALSEIRSLQGETQKDVTELLMSSDG